MSEFNESQRNSKVIPSWVDAIIMTLENWFHVCWFDGHFLLSQIDWVVQRLASQLWTANSGVAVFSEVSTFTVFVSAIVRCCEFHNICALNLQIFAGFVGHRPEFSWNLPS